MEQPPPLTPQEIAARQTAEYADTGQPQTVKVFGILHLVIGVCGILLGIISLAIMLGSNPFLSLVPKTPGATAQMEQQAAMQSEMMPVTIVTYIIYMATTFFIIKAGIHMLKRRRNGLKWSNRYAWTSLGGKVFYAFITYFYTYPMIKETQVTPAMGGAMAGTFEIVMMASMIAGIVIPCIYPILTLILLNRPKTKEWFAAQLE